MECQSITFTGISYMNDNEKALALAKEVMNNGGLYQLFTHDEYPTVWLSLIHI